MCPRRPVIVVAERGEGREASFREVLIDTPDVLEDFRVVARQIARHDHDVRTKIGDAAEGGENVIVIHARTHVYVAELDERPAGESLRQTTDR